MRLATFHPLLLVLACGGRSEAPAAAERGATAADLSQYCNTMCERSAVCVGDPEFSDEICRAECQNPKIDIGLFRADAVQAVQACVADLPCDHSDDACADQVLAELVPNGASSPLLASCFANECGQFDEEACSDALLFTARAQADFAACFELSCSAAEVCIEELLYPALRGRYDDPLSGK